MFTSIGLVIDQFLKQNMGISKNYKQLKQWNYLAAQRN